MGMGPGGFQSVESLALSAIEGGDVAVLEQLHEEGFEFEKMFYRGKKYSIVHNSAALGGVDVLRFCAAHGFDMNVRDAMGFNAVFFAVGCETNSMEALSILASAGVDFHHVDKFGESAVFYAASTGDLEAMKFIQQQGVDLTHLNPQGDSAALVAAGGGHLEMLQFLHQHGVDVAHVNDDGVNAALVAARGCHLNVLRYLHDLDVPLTAVDKKGRGIMWYVEDMKEENPDVKQKRQEVLDFLKANLGVQPSIARVFMGA
eukprot:TRINITY_DN6677_c0_g2_i2.p1 TRINITY_DN6677_c0_g2~~TRINITY_DN6677_c0_g2_i2.p1  ORF type:complete len:259 (-),score=44.28 TRINITY_DN6677_c0_g2_i2:154-930(-)